MEYGKQVYEDYLHCDHVWQRVAPELEPYPAVRSTVPAAAANCCIARRREEAEQLVDFIGHELVDRQVYCQQLRVAPPAARRVLRQLVEEEGGHARRLMGLYYMMTGQCCRTAPPAADGECLAWCAFLRRRYEEECAGGYAYAKAAEETEDECLRRTLQRMSADEYRHAEMLVQLWEGNLSR